MNEIRISAAAEREYVSALVWYSDRSLQAAENFDRDFDDSLTSISENPALFPLLDDRHRFYLLRRYPFLVIYRIEQDGILIVAIAHTSRRPGYWNDR